jgi:hypothetical protein
MAQIQKQTEAKVKSQALTVAAQTKVSSVILDGAESPTTPDKLISGKDSDSPKENPVNVLGSETLENEAPTENKKATETSESKKPIELDMQPRLSFRRKDDPEVKSNEVSNKKKSQAVGIRSVAKDKSEGMVKLRASKANEQKEKSLDQNIGDSSTGATGPSIIPRSRLAPLSTKQETNVKPSLGRDHVSKLAHAYLAKPADRKLWEKNLSPIASSKLGLGKLKAAPPAPFPRYEGIIKTKTLRKDHEDEFVVKQIKGGDPASNSMFPRNRFGIGRTESTTKATPLLQQGATKFSQVNHRPLEKRGTLAPLPSTRQGMSLPSRIDHLSQANRPPLPPPKRIRRPTEEELMKEKSLNRAREVQEIKVLGDALQPHALPMPILKQLEKDGKDPSYLSPKPSMLDSFRGHLHSDEAMKVTESMKRRAARIKAQLRDDVYCSSDEDIVSSMRQKVIYFTDQIPQEILFDVF